MYEKIKSYFPLHDLEWMDFFKKAALFSLLFHILTPIFSEGFHRPDEHLGMFRYVAMKLGIAWNQTTLSHVNWEYTAQIRPWLQPAAYYSLSKIFYFFGGESPFYLAHFLRISSSILGFFTLIPLALMSYRLINNTQWRKISLCFIFAFWYLPFFHARMTAENIGMSLFILGISPLLLQFNEKDFSPKSSGVNRDLSTGLIISILCGVLLGFSFISRYQMVLMIAPFWIWLLIFSRVKYSTLAYLAFGIILAQGIGLLIDQWGYHTWVFTPYNYFVQNIIEGKAAGFGVSPWYYYLKKSFAKGVPPLSLVLIIPFFWLWIKKPKNLLTSLSIFYFVIHCFIGHKELRFIFALGLITCLIAPLMGQELGLEKLYNEKKWFRFLTKFIIFQNMLLLMIASLKPAYTPLAFYKHLYIKNNPITKIYTLSVFRDQLKIYLKSPYEEVLVKDISEVKEIIQKDSETSWFLTNKYSHILDFRNNKKCIEDYISYPNWVFKLNIGNWMKRSKIWALYHCKG